MAAVSMSSERLDASSTPNPAVTVPSYCYRIWQVLFSSLGRREQRIMSPRLCFTALFFCGAATRERP